MASNDDPKPVKNVAAAFMQAFGGGSLPRKPATETATANKPNSLYTDDGAGNIAYTGQEIAFAATNLYGGLVSQYMDPNFGIQGGNGLDTQRGSGSIQNLLIQAIPKGKSDRIARAQKWIQEDDLLQRLIEVKMDFAISGFSCQVQPPEDFDETDASTKQMTVYRKKVRQARRVYNLRKVALDLFKDYFTTDTAILYFRTRKQGTPADGASNDFGVPNPSSPIPNLVDVCTLNPADVDWDDSLGVEVLKVRIPDALRDRIELALNAPFDKKDQMLRELLESGVGQKWIDAVKSYKADRSGRVLVELRREDGDNWIVSTKGRKHHGLANPSMFTIFLSLELRRSLIEGDFSTAFMMKHFIMLIQEGESITNGPLAGSRQNWLSKTDAEALLKVFTGVNKAMRLAMNHTVKVSFVYPPKEMFAADKYATCEQRIFNWAGITQAVMSGDGGTYSGGFIGIKKLIANLCNARQEISDMLTLFFSHPDIAPSIGIPDDYEVIARFDEQMLKEPAQLLDEIKALSNFGWVDPRTALRELGRDPETIKSLLSLAKKENDNTGVWETLAALAALHKAGNPGDEPGRPANPGTTKGPATLQQRPSPQT